MATVIPKQPKKERDQITIRLDRDVLQTLEHYCRYLESGPRLRDQPVPGIYLSKRQALHDVARRPGNRQPFGDLRRSRGATAKGFES
jgi:hypothetical protein